MSTYETFAIVGLGRLGIDIARGILEVKRSKRPEVNVKLIIRHVHQWYLSLLILSLTKM